jgi:hypothetical protein
MILATEFPQLSGKYATVLPPCPNCGRPTYLARTIPGWGGLPDSCVFKCGECAVWVTESADERRDVQFCG